MTSFRILLILAFLVPLAVFLTTPKETMVPGFFSDEAVYFAMIQSLAHDRDLEWTREDLERICETHPAGPVGVILKKLPSGKIVYAKPLTYPLAAVIFYSLFGIKGITVFNLLLMWFIVYLLAKRWNSSAGAVLSALAFVGLSAYSPYILWFHPEIFTSFLLVVFFWNWLTNDHPSSSGFSDLSIVCLGLAVTIKPPLVLLGIPVAIDLVKKRQYRPFAVFFITLIVIAVFTVFFTGHVNPYEGNRRIFIDRFPIDSQENLFDHVDGWSMKDAGFYFDTNVFLWNCLFFFIGRYSGITWYFFPGVITALLAVISPSNLKGKWLAAVTGTLVLIHILMIPSNYHGGGGALGNRYFVSLYPLLLLALPRLPGRKTLFTLTAISAFLSGPFLIHPWLSSYQPGEFTRSGLYSRLPVEWTLIGAYPIFHPDLYRVTLPGAKGHWYFLDHRSSGKKDQGFEVLSGPPAHIMLEMDEERDFLDIFTTSPDSLVYGVVYSQDASTDFYADPERTRCFRLHLGTGHRKTDIYGRTRWIYHLRFHLTHGKSFDNDMAGETIPSKVFFRLLSPDTVMEKKETRSQNRIIRNEI
jgi:hypothetical protein